MFCIDYQQRMQKQEDRKVALINFQLAEIENIAPFGSEETGYRLHWFGLTDSFYWLNVCDCELFRLSDQFLTRYRNHTKLPYVNYYLARLIEDLFEILPSIATPIPDRLFQYISSISEMEKLQNKLYVWLENKWSEDENEFDQVYVPSSDWLHNRTLNTGYLRAEPDIKFFRHKNDLVIRWNFEYQEEETNMWTASKGEYTLCYKEFIKEIEDFYDRFWIEMKKQIDLVCQGLLRTDIMIDLDGLQKEHIERKKRLDEIMDLLKSDSFEPVEEWNKVEMALHYIIK